MRLQFRSLIFSGILFGLVACGGQTVVPPDQFYRFPPVPVERIYREPVIPGELLIDSVDAGPLYQDRALLFSSDQDGIRLEQHHYHHWAESPVQLIRRFTLASLRDSGVSETVVMERRDRGLALVAQLLRFERHQFGGENKSIVAIRFTLSDQAAGRVLLDKHYESIKVIATDSPLETVQGLRQATHEVLKALIDDLGKQVMR